MTHPETSPLEHTPSSKVRHVVIVVSIGAAVALLLNPGSLGRWAYMLNETAWNRPLVVVSQRMSDIGSGTYTHLGVLVPFDAMAHVGTWLRTFLPANPDVGS
jgi:hypothetical protein